MLINVILDRVLNDSRCKVILSKSIQKTWRGLDLPSDMSDFYSRIEKFTFDTEEYWFEFSSLDECTSLQDKSFFPQECNGEIISNSWCIFAAQETAYIAIDLDKKRFGRCYHVEFADSYFVLDMSFTDVVLRILDNNGKWPEWFGVDFTPITDICNF
jgi:hypothetical protein